MRFLYVGSFDKPYQTEVYISNSLEFLGHEVTRVQNGLGHKKEVKEALEESDHDVVLFGKGWYDGNINEFKELLGRTPGVKVGWFFDLMWNTARQWQLFKHPAFLADIVFTTDGGHEVEFEKAGINHHILRQGIYEPEAVLGLKREQFDCDVAFVGSSDHLQWFGWDYRDKLLSFLKKTYGERFKWFGQDREIRNLELNDLYASAKVVVGDSVYSPNYWSNRVYETIGRGGFLIFPMVPGLEKEFKPYKHFVPYDYHDWEGLQTKIDYYIAHDKERRKIAFDGFKFTRKVHTYTKRCEELVAEINAYRKRMGR